MNLTRYAIAGASSLVIHAALLFVSQETKVFAMPSGNPVSSVSVNLVSVPTAAESKTAQQKRVAETKPEQKPQPKKGAETNKRERKQTQTHKYLAKKKAPEEVAKKKIVENVSKPNTPRMAEHKNPIKKSEPQQKETIKKSVSQVPPHTVTSTQQSKGVSAQPVLLNRPTFVSQPTQPRYPRLARKRGIEGVALYEVWLDKNGNQIKQILLESSGAEMLDSSALKAIKQWQFSPHISDGQRVAHRVQIPVRFKLDG